MSGFISFQLLSSDLITNGASDEGIDGFLVDDIRTMLKAYTKTKCYYCPEKFATVKCCAPRCMRKFHVVCGIARKCQNEFTDPYRSYCHDHIQIEEDVNKHAPDAICPICFEALGEYNVLTSIPACCPTDYYHKSCMQKSAVKLGSLLKCPSCGDDKNADTYQQLLSKRGIFCPDKDAGMCCLADFILFFNEMRTKFEFFF